MNGQVADGASAGDQDQYGAEGRHAPQGDRSSRRRSPGVRPDPAPPPGEPGRTRKLVRRSRGRALNRVRQAHRRVRVSAGAEVEHLLPQSRRERGRWSDAGKYRRAQRTATALLAGLAPFDVLCDQISRRRGQRRQLARPSQLSKLSSAGQASLPIRATRSGPRALSNLPRARVARASTLSGGMPSTIARSARSRLCLRCSSMTSRSS